VQKQGRSLVEWSNDVQQAKKAKQRCPPIQSINVNVPIVRGQMSTRINKSTIT